MPASWFKTGQNPQDASSRCSLSQVREHLGTHTDTQCQRRLRVKDASQLSRVWVLSELRLAMPCYEDGREMRRQSLTVTACVEVSEGVQVSKKVVRSLELRGRTA